MKSNSYVVAVAVTIVLSIVLSMLVALWITSLTFQYMCIEELRIVATYVTFVNNNLYNITVIVRNTGTVQSTVHTILVNELPVENNVYPTLPLTINPSSEARLVLTIRAEHGQMINIVLRTKRGNIFFTTIIIP